MATQSPLKPILRHRLYRNKPGKRHFAPTAPSDEIRAALGKLRPVSVGKSLIRIGGEGDGGYLVPDDLSGIEACFSPGVSTVADFELMLAERYGIRSFMADGSVEGAPLSHPLFDFEKKFLGATPSASHIRLEDWVNAKVGRADGRDLLLQMDIESSEFEVLLDASPTLLRRFRIIVIEFHQMEMVFERHALAFLRLILDKLALDFHPVHVHPNNAANTLILDGIEVPNVFEVTYYRKDRSEPDGAALSFPHQLDRKNIEANEDLVLPRHWWA